VPCGWYTGGNYLTGRGRRGASSAIIPAVRLPSPPPVPSPGSLGARAVNALTRLHVTLYRRSGGRIGRKLAGAPVLLLEHVGRRSGRRRTTPLLYLDDGADLVIVASRGGSDAPPAWWLNLEATPRTTVQVGRERREVLARTASPEEKARLWPCLVELYPDYRTYQERTEREIPVVVLEPAGTGSRST
jgi:F420H(2)-dependent quinone reductase